MKQLYQARLRRLLGVSAAIIVLAIAGYGRHSTAKNPHLAFFHAAGETVFIDSMDSRVAMDSRGPDSSASSSALSLPGGGSSRIELSCFLMSWADNLKLDDEMGMARREEYIQFGMRRDWVALAGGDSIYASFFRQRPLLDRHLHQWALVFPVPAGRRIDTIAYTGTVATWGKRLFILNRK